MNCYTFSSHLALVSHHACMSFTSEDVTSVYYLHNQERIVMQATQTLMTIQEITYLVWSTSGAVGAHARRPERSHCGHCARRWHDLGLTATWPPLILRPLHMWLRNGRGVPRCFSPKALFSRSPCAEMQPAAFFLSLKNERIHEIYPGAFHFIVLCRHMHTLFKLGLYLTRNLTYLHNFMWAWTAAVNEAGLVRQLTQCLQYVACTRDYIKGVNLTTCIKIDLADMAPSNSIASILKMIVRGHLSWN